MKTTKRFLALALAVMTMLSLTIPVSAAAWKQDNTGWWYQEDNGSYPANTWKWIDGNNDGVAECYYFDGNGYMLTNTTTPDGYQVNASGAWVVNGVVQTQAAGSAGNVAHSGNYDPAHPLAGKIDEWDLRLTDENQSRNVICDWNVHAMLTNQMNQYFAAPVGDYVDARGNHIYTTQEDYNAARNNENALYNWFCNWLNSIDFRTMSETQRAQEIKKVMASTSYDNAYATSARYNRNSYYTVLIDKKGVCGELTMTATSLAEALGLESSVTGFGDHAWYFIKADGYWYEGNNTYLDMSNPLTEEQYRARR